MADCPGGDGLTTKQEANATAPMVAPDRGRLILATSLERHLAGALLVTC
jgi:hypothetical protein